MTHNQYTPPIQFHYALSNKYFYTVTTEATEESTHFLIYLEKKHSYLKVQPENNLYLPVSYKDNKTEAQTLEPQNQQLKHKQPFFEMCPTVQQTDVTLNTNKTEPYTLDSTNANYAEMINSIKLSLPAKEDFIPKLPKNTTISMTIKRKLLRLLSTFTRPKQKQY